MTSIAKPAILHGVYDIPADEYHASPALSSTGVRKLLAPSCPALFDYERGQGEKHRRTFDIGTVAHTILFGNGSEPHVVDADNYLTKLAKQDRDAAYERGDVPLLPAEFDAVQEMVAAARRHPRVAELLAEGQAEQSLFWTDPATGVPCRARLDWLRPDGVVDFKTTTEVDPGHIAKSVANFGYHIQAAVYLAGAVELGILPADAPFYFIFQSKNPPHLIKVVELDETALEIGREKFEQALEVFRDCSEAGIWPDYGSDIEVIALPAYEVRRHFQGAFA